MRPRLDQICLRSSLWHLIIFGIGKQANIFIHEVWLSDSWSWCRVSCSPSRTPSGLLKSTVLLGIERSSWHNVEVVGVAVLQPWLPCLGIWNCAFTLSVIDSNSALLLSSLFPRWFDLVWRFITFCTNSWTDLRSAMLRDGAQCGKTATCEDISFPVKS